MVTVDHRTLEQTRDWADRRLGVLLTEWRDLPCVLEEINDWDPAEAMDYIEEWRFLESQRAAIERVAERGLLTDEQIEKLEHLREFVTEHQPELQRLLGC